MFVTMQLRINQITIQYLSIKYNSWQYTLRYRAEAQF